MTIDAEELHNQRFDEIGRMVIAHSEKIIDEWCLRAGEVHVEARIAYRGEMRNALPEFLRSMGAALRDHGNRLESVRQQNASDHGVQRWQNRWRLSDVVADYQLLRLTMLEFLDSQLPRPLSLKEILAIGLLLDDAITAAVVTYVDIQERHLADTEQQTRKTFENAAVGIAHVLADGTWIRVNQRFSDTVSYSLEELQKKTLFEITALEDRGDVSERFAELATGTSICFTLELRLISHNGGLVWVQLTGSALHDEEGRVQYLILILEDITVRKRLDRELEEARETAERASVAKSQFVANVSHEIRTPMTAILGLTELALEEPLTPLVQDFLATTHDSARSLLSLLNDILDLSKIEAGKLELDSTPFDLYQLVDDTIRQQGLRASAKGIELLADIDASTPQFVRGDALRIRQVLANLTSNALKFTDQGEVRVHLTHEPVTEDVVLVKCSVIDSGIGISESDQQRIFKPFAQVDCSATGVVGGSGLGLAIAMELVHRMQGQLGVTSKLGEGSEFCFSVPLDIELDPESVRKHSTKGQIELPPLSQPLSILVVEDIAANQKVLQTILMKRGHRVTIANNGRDALDRHRRESFDVLLMDVQMPTMDGFQATSHVRKMEDPKRAAVPIVAMTAHAMRGDAEKCLAAGMNAFVSKPIDARHLIWVVEHVHNKDNARSSSSSQPASILQPEIPSSGKPSHGPSEIANLEMSLARLAGHHELLLDLIGFFIADAPPLLRTLEASISAQDAEAARLASHSLKGLAAHFDAMACVHAAAEIEMAAQRLDWVTCRQSLGSLQRNVLALIGFLEDYSRTTRA